MSKTDRLKEEIAWLKLLIGACATLAASLIAWLVRNYEMAHPIIASLAVIVAAIAAMLVVVSVSYMYRCFKRLEVL
jgi:hypothetical protein